MKFESGNKVRVIKTYYPHTKDIVGKESIVEIRGGSIYLSDLNLYINEDCIEHFDEKISGLDINDVIWNPISNKI